MGPAEGALGYQALNAGASTDSTRHRQLTGDRDVGCMVIMQVDTSTHIPELTAQLQHGWKWE